MGRLIWAVLLLVFSMGCAEQISIEDLSEEEIQKIVSSLSEEDIDKLISCDAPYIRFEIGCCLDQNSNKICDTHEVKSTSTTTSTTTTTLAPTTTTQEPTTTTTTTLPPTTTTTVEALDLEFSIGETAAVDGLEITVLSVDYDYVVIYYSDILKNYGDMQAGPGNNFAVFEVEAKNTGSSTTYVGQSSFSLTDSEGIRYDVELYPGDDGFGHLKELYQNQKTTGKIVFKIPTKVPDGLRVLYNYGDIFSGTKLVSWDVN